MTRPEFEELADLWKEPGDVGQAEQSEFEALARKVRLRARLMAWGDTAWLILVAGSAVVVAFLHPSTLSFVGAAATIAMTFWLNWKRRWLRRMEACLDTSDRATFLASNIQVVRANLRRVTFSLTTFLPGLFIAILYIVLTRDPSHPMRAFLAWVGSARGLIGLGVLAVLVGLALRSRRRLKDQLKGLEKLRQVYADEASLDERDASGD
ncbi:MAG TPA: hypothetical protein VF652_06545 [Allosphingosinicella sp.]|jgi:hypothetical protein